MPKEQPPVFLADADLGENFTDVRLRWLIDLRWVAMAGVLFAAGLAASGAFPGVAWPLMVVTASVGSSYNLALSRRQRRGLVKTDRAQAVRQALIDLTLLTVVLWAAGGIESPFLGYYIFHVALSAILGGPRATRTATAVAFTGAGLLSIAHAVPELSIGHWNPVPPWDRLANIGAFATTVGAAAYIVTHAVRELRDRERALERARDRAALEYQLLSNTLDQLEAGLEVVGPEGHVLWRNKRAEELAPWAKVGDVWSCPGAGHNCERDASGVCPVSTARDVGNPGRCRFAAPANERERVYEMMVFPLEADASGQPRIMNLYIDRTQATLAEQRLVLAERLASLGRVAQGVAHELNTPLATVRTLATDMRAALRALRDGDADVDAAALVADVDESAEMIQDETRRLGRITQSLLAGGDLVRARIDGAVPLGAVVERARALVFAGVREGPHVEVDPSVGALRVSADPDRLMQVLVNLLQNARDAVREAGGGSVTLRAQRAGASVELVVEDDGPGIAETVRARLFEPFATSKPPGEGTGLGLYTSYMLVQAMGGDLTLENRDEGGARAVVRLPAADGDEGLVSSARLTQRASA